jgi:DNA polymerase I-like protein with 3'-5' exonuclease and polymerase domains
MNEAIGRADSPYLVVMLAPPSKKMMDWFLAKVLSAGIIKSDLRIVYMLDEPPQGANGKGTKEQFRRAAPRFEREMAESQPRVTLPMGGEATRALTGIQLPIFDTRGYIILPNLFRTNQVEVFTQVGVYKSSNKTTGRKVGDPKMKWEKQAAAPLAPSPVVPLFTLDHIRVEGFGLSPVLKEDLLRARRIATGFCRPVTDAARIVYTVDEFKAMKFPLSPWIAVDIETHGINNEVIDLVSFSDGVTATSFDWSEEVRLLMEWLFRLPDVYFTLHNSPFDLPRLRANGVFIDQKVVDTRVFDTMFGAVLLQPDLHKSLGRTASLYLDTYPWKWRMLSEADPKRYSALDSFHTSLLCQVQAAVMRALGCWNLFMGQGGHPGPGEMATIPVLTEMSREGLPLNVKYIREVMLPKLERRNLRYQQLWTKHFPETKASSSKALQKLFYGEWGLPVQRSRGDGITVDELALVSLSAFVETQRHFDQFDGPWKHDPRCNRRTFDLLMKLRDTAKLLGTYVGPTALLTEARVHPSYLPVSKDDEKGANKTMSSKGNTSTGRLASFGPNIQNQPKAARWMYVPDQPTHAFVQADYRSAELYVMAQVSGDRKLLADLSKDMHQLNADRLGITRKVAKNVLYASQYLAGPSKQSEMILKQEHLYVSPAECLRISQAIWQHYDKATAYKEHLITLCKQKKYIQNAFGRVRFFHANEAPAAVDFIPQSTVADVLWCVLKPVSDMAKSYGGRMYTTVHDSILIAVPAEYRDVAAKEMVTIMEQRFENVAPGFFIPVEVETAGPGEPWACVRKGQ